MSPSKIDREKAKKAELKMLKAENKQLKKEIRRIDRSVAEATALLVLKKDMATLEGAKGRCVSAPERKKAVELVSEACFAGARKHKVCEDMGISVNTLNRWEKEDGFNDKRKINKRAPANKLTPEKRNRIIAIARSEEYKNLPACKIVALLGDKGVYIASTSTCYRVLREAKKTQHS